MSGNFEVLTPEKASDIKKMRELLRVATCPDLTCDEGIAQVAGEFVRCQWCAERDELLAEHG